MNLDAETRLREEVSRVGRSLYDRGYAHGTAGNISVRLDDGSFLITPTDVSLGTLAPQRLAKVGADGIQLSGDTASKTLALHRAIYAAAREVDDQVSCIIHTHSHHCVALSLTQAGQAELLPVALTPYFLMKVGRVPLLAYQRPGHPAVAAHVAALIAGYAEQSCALRCLMLERLGPVVWHSSPAAAMAVLEELEATARLAWDFLGERRADPQSLSEEAVAELKQVFGARW